MFKEHPFDAAWLTLLPAYDHWVQGEVNEAFIAVEAWAQSYAAWSSTIQAVYAPRLGSFYWALGQLGRAKDLLGRSPVALRHGYLVAFADAIDDHEGLHDHMTAFMSLQPSNRYLFGQVRSGLMPDPAVVQAEPGGHQQLLAGEQAFRRGDWRDAIASLAPGVEWSRDPSRSDRTLFYMASEYLATAWLEVGEDTQALHVLAQAAQGRPRYRRGGLIEGARVWCRAQARLAREYRKLGRTSEAVAIEDDVLHMLKYADADHPIVIEI